MYKVFVISDSFECLEELFGGCSAAMYSCLEGKEGVQHYIYKFFQHKVQFLSQETRIYHPLHIDTVLFFFSAMKSYG